MVSDLRSMLRRIPFESRPSILGKKDNFGRKTNTWYVVLYSRTLKRWCSFDGQFLTGMGSWDLWVAAMLRVQGRVLV